MEELSEESPESFCEESLSLDVSSPDDVIALKNMNVYAAIIGKAYYTGAIDLNDAIEAAK